MIFQNDYEIAYYLNAIELVFSSTIELATGAIELDIKYLSHKLKRKETKNNRSFDGENHSVAVSKLKKLKRKDIS